MQPRGRLTSGSKILTISCLHLCNPSFCNLSVWLSQLLASHSLGLNSGNSRDEKISELA